MRKVTKIPRLKPRAADAHKGDFGKICIIAGSIGMSGAAALAGRAALRAGAGLVRVATPQSILPIVASIEPSFTTIPLPEDNAGRIAASAANTILNLIPDNDCFAFGPGLGITQGVSSVLERLLEQKGLRLIIDADGLNNLSKINDWPRKNKADIILTPHPGEMKRLWAGLFRTPLPTDRKIQAMQMANKTGTIVV
ncbi:MAG TPA: NAD(P)H-hydrate dehydratase, partial [Sedimentisphaerales bacterium]